MALPLSALADRFTVKALERIDGELAHGVVMTADNKEYPILIKTKKFKDPFYGVAVLNNCLRANIVVRQFMEVELLKPGYVVSLTEGYSGLKPVSKPSSELCSSAKLDAGTKVSIILPDGMDIISR